MVRRFQNGNRQCRSRKKKNIVPMMNDSKTIVENVMKECIVDVLIPVYKPGPEFTELLRRLDNQVYPIHKILIVNTDESYWNALYEKECPGCEVIHISKEQFDHGGTRHWMAERSGAEVMVFMTQDALPVDDKLIGHLVQAFENDKVKAAYARQLARPDCELLEKYTRYFNYPDNSRIQTKEDLSVLGIKTFFCSNVCAAYNRETYMELGGFPLKTIFNEDMIYAGKLINFEYAIAYISEAKVIHSHNYTNRQQFQRNFALAVSQVQHPELFSKYPSEREGIKLVKNISSYICREKKPWLIFPLLFKSVSKYAGYLLGKRYRKLPKWLIKKILNEF